MMIMTLSLSPARLMMASEYCSVDFGPKCCMRGRMVKARESDTPVGAFLGIPYAEPPVGERRFQFSKPLQHLWEGTRDAVDFGKYS